MKIISSPPIAVRFQRGIRFVAAIAISIPVLFGYGAFAQNSTKQSQKQSNCFKWNGKWWKWINVANGKEVPGNDLYPHGANPDDANHASIPSGPTVHGDTFVRGPDNTWINVANGKEVPGNDLYPHGANPDDANHASIPSGPTVHGDTFVRVPCEEEANPLSSTTGGVKTAASQTAAANDLFQLGVGYSFMRAAQEEAKNLNGFQVSGFYNVNSWLAVGGDFSGLYGSHSSGGVDVSLDRYLYLFGPQVAFQPIPKLQPVKIVGHVLVGGVHDENEFKYPGMTVRSSANAFAMTVGGGVDVQVTPHVSVGPSFDYTPTAFSAPNSHWQNNWRAGIEAKVKF